MGCRCWVLHVCPWWATCSVTGLHHMHTNFGWCTGGPCICRNAALTVMHTSSRCEHDNTTVTGCVLGLSVVGAAIVPLLGDVLCYSESSRGQIPGEEMERFLLSRSDLCFAASSSALAAMSSRPNLFSKRCAATEPFHSRGSMETMSGVVPCNHPPKNVYRPQLVQ